MGTTDKTKRLVNILSETLLIMACYYLCGVIRVYLPWGRAYAFRDTLAYGYLAVLYTAVFVLIHDLSGGYKSLKFGGFRREILRIAVGELLGCLVMTSVIYIFRLEKLRRLAGAAVCRVPVPPDVFPAHGKLQRAPGGRGSGNSPAAAGPGGGCRWRAALPRLCGGCPL